MGFSSFKEGQGSQMEDMRKAAAEHKLKSKGVGTPNGMTIILGVGEAKHKGMPEELEVPESPEKEMDVGEGFSEEPDAKTLKALSQGAFEINGDITANGKPLNPEWVKGIITDAATELLQKNEGNEEVS